MKRGIPQLHRLIGGPNQLRRLVAPGQRAYFSSDQAESELAMDPILLYQHYYSVIYQQIRGRISHHEQAEDLTQDTFIKALRALDRAPDNPHGLHRWLSCIARNTVIDYARQVRRKPVSELAEEHTVTAGNVLESIALRMEIQAVFHQLPGRSRQVLLASAEGYTTLEIAKMLEISHSLAKVRLSRARRQFQQRYLAAQERGVPHG